MSPSQEITAEFALGQRVIYTRMQRPVNTEWPAMYVRAQETAGRLMHVISLDANPRPRQVGWKSIRAETPPPEIDPTPYCSACGAKHRAQYDCPPIPANDLRFADYERERCAQQGYGMRTIYRDPIE